MKDLLRSILHKYKYTVPNNVKGITEDLFLDVILRDGSLTREFNYSPNALSRFLSNYFPDRPKTKCNLRTWLLSKENLKTCPRCQRTLKYTSFDNNYLKGDGKSSYCRPCNLSAHGNAYYSAYSALRYSNLCGISARLKI